MDNNKEHISMVHTVGKAHLPLYEFFIVLKGNNFLVTAEQISDANQIIGQYAHSLKNEWELCDYLSPIFANSQEEQIRFKQIFEEHFCSQTPNISEEPKKAKNKIWFYLFILLVALLGSWFISKIFFDKKPDPEEIVYQNCPETASISIFKSFSEDSIKVGTPIKLNAVITGKQPDSISWSSSNQGVLEADNAHTIATTANKQGIQTFYCKAFYNSENTLCYVSGEISFTVYDTTPIPKVEFIASANAQPNTLTNKVNGYWFAMLGILAALSLYLTTLFAQWRNQLKKQNIKVDTENQNAYDSMINSFSGKAGTSEVPFHDKNFLILPEPGLSEIATQMRKRISDDATYIHIGKTISKVILNGGYFDPVIVARTQQSQFLVLIDKNHQNDQQVKLFDFLIAFLKKQNVYIDTYYFKKSPLQCYRETEDKETSLEKLTEKYPEHILLIFGNAHQLIYPDYPSMDRYCMHVLERWQYKAVMTPVSYMDWGNKEKNILLPLLPVFPVDTYGLLLLMPKLFEEDLNILSQLNKSSEHFYSVEMVDFEDIYELLEYCSKVEWANIPGESNYSNIIFQWIAALAVYPKIRWELILKIGKALLEKYDLKHALNFTTLLRLVRISWMKSGTIPDFMRLNLLKHLNVENEILTRETILNALNEISIIELNPMHFAFEEKETQRIINEFNLYAYNSVKYAMYSHSKELFAKLNAKDLITDVTAKTYLENSNLNWHTLINRQDVSVSLPHKPENIGLKEYLDEKPKKNSRKENVYLWATSLSSLLFVASLLGLAALAFLDISGNYKFEPFTNAPPTSKTVQINYNNDFAVASINRDITLSIDSVSVKLSRSSNSNENNISSLFSQISVPIDEAEKLVRITWDKIPVFNEIMHINYDSYDVIMHREEILDTDNDGMLDKDDNCPNEAGPADNNGCPWPDTDGDGVFDKDDQCPKEKGNITNNGCPERKKTSENIDDKLEQKRIDALKNTQNQPRKPIDTDGDGVSDEKDKCPNVKGTAANYGCPEVVQEENKEPVRINAQQKQQQKQQPQTQQKTHQQQQQQQQQQVTSEQEYPKAKDSLNNNQKEQRIDMDTDYDGVLDKDDKCPEVKGNVANNGCPEVNNEVIKILNEYAKAILFDVGKSKINKNSIIALEDIANILKEYPSSKVLIEVHTDTNGNEKANQKLSDDRANSIKQYLIKFGIDANSLSAKGYGDSRPIDSNNTSKGRANNSRIEINITN